MVKFINVEDRLKWLVGFAKWQFDIPLETYMPLVQIIDGREFIFQYAPNDIIQICCQDPGDWNSWKILQGKVNPYKSIFSITNLDKFAEDTAEKMFENVVAWDEWTERPLDWNTYFEARKATLDYYGENGFDFDEFQVTLISHVSQYGHTVDVVRIETDDEFRELHVEVTYSSFDQVIGRTLSTVRVDKHPKDFLTNYTAEFMAEVTGE